MVYSELVKKAAQISFEAHKEDIDKNGYPYFMHPMTLALQFDDEESVCVALLHDVIEDHGDKYTFKYLEEQGFSQNIISALKLLTHQKGIAYLDYVRAIKQNELAKRVKLADLKHNTNLDRCNGRKPPKYELYLEAIDLLEKPENPLSHDNIRKPVLEAISEYYEEEKADDLPSSLYKTYDTIAKVMRGNPYRTDENRKQLAKDIRKYVLDVLNEKNKGKYLYDAVYASQSFHFYSKQLGWNKSQWKKSAEIVYNYYKAAKLIEIIKSYEPVAGKPIVVDYRALIDYIYTGLSIGEEILFSNAPGLTSDFNFVPQELLDEKLEEFKKLYE